MVAFDRRFRRWFADQKEFRREARKHGEEELSLAAKRRLRARGIPHECRTGSHEATKITKDFDPWMASLRDLRGFV
jgi:hypothetical protein